MRNTRLIAMLGVTRDGIEDVFADVAALSRIGPLPCSAVEAHNAIRDRQLLLETQVTEAARAAGIKPPEEVPRAIDGFGACPPNVEEAALPVGTQKILQDKAADVVKRRGGITEAFAKAMAQSADFRRFVQSQTAASAPVKPEPRHIFALGGSPWMVPETVRLLSLPLTVPSEADAYALVIDVAKTRSALLHLQEHTAPAPPSKWKWPLLIGGGAVATLSAAGGLWYALGRKGGSSPEETDFAEE